MLMKSCSEKVFLAFFLPALKGWSSFGYEVAPEFRRLFQGTDISHFLYLKQ